MRELIIVLLMLSGLFFFAVGTVGIIRFPDALTRAHGAAKCDTLGAALCLLALIVYSGINIVSLKLFLVIAFIWVTNPTATHAIARGILASKANVKGGSAPR